MIDGYNADPPIAAALRQAGITPDEWDSHRDGEGPFHFIFERHRNGTLTVTRTEPYEE